jgi:DNA-binding response OmpR family regulator
VEAVVIVRSADRWLPRLSASLSELVSRRALVVHSLADAEAAMLARSPDVVVFDPAVTGTDFPLVVEGRGNFRTVGWLGSRSSPVVATLLAAGAEDVLDASMGDEEIVARLRRCLNRGVGRATVPLEVGALRLDARNRMAEWAGKPLPLTAREVEVLQVLAASHRRPVRREVIYRLVWGWSMPRGDRAVDVNVKRLRDKLANAGVALEIRTHAGVGYALHVHAPEQVVSGL